MSKVDIGISDDYCNTDIGPYMFYFGYEHQMCQLHGLDECECEDTDDAFIISNAGEVVYSLSRSDIDERTARNNLDTPEEYCLAGILCWLDDNNVGKLIKETKRQKMKKHMVCFTGFRDKFLEMAVARIGGVVQKSVTKDTTILVAEDRGMLSTTKAQKAEKLGVKILSKREFQDWLKKQPWIN